MAHQRTLAVAFTLVATTGCALDTATARDQPVLNDGKNDGEDVPAGASDDTGNYSCAKRAQFSINGTLVVIDYPCPPRQLEDPTIAKSIDVRGDLVSPRAPPSIDLLDPFDPY